MAAGEHVLRPRALKASRRRVRSGRARSGRAEPPFDPIAWLRGLPRFAKEVRAEGRKTTWTSPKETWITSVMVFIMVLTATVFFLTVDWGVSMLVGIIIKLPELPKFG